MSVPHVFSSPLKNSLWAFPRRLSLVTTTALIGCLIVLKLKWFGCCLFEVGLSQVTGSN